jgi:hypothetical protein
MRRFVIASSLALPLALGGCGVEASTAAGASLNAKPELKPEPVKNIQPLEPALRQPASPSVFVLDQKAGTIHMGDDQHGKRLPAGDRSPATYQIGKGAATTVDPPATHDLSSVATPKLAVPLQPVKDEKPAADSEE